MNGEVEFLLRVVSGSRVHVYIYYSAHVLSVVHYKQFVDLQSRDALSALCVESVLDGELNSNHFGEEISVLHSALMHLDLEEQN